MTESKSLQELRNLLQRQILILDGAMGTMIQTYGLKEGDFRRGRFESHHKELKGNNDILSLTRPDIIEEIHLKYLQAGANIIETNTFSATRLGQRDYGLEGIVCELNVQAARVAREACVEYLRENPKRHCFVAGAMGPTNRTASLSPDVNNPAFRAVTFDELAENYYEQVKGLIDGCADILLAETVFDTLNLKACIFAIKKFEEDRQTRCPVMLSVTISDASGRTLSGQTVEAFWNSVRHAQPLSVGINCSLGAKEMRPFIKNIGLTSSG